MLVLLVAPNIFAQKTDNIAISKDGSVEIIIPTGWESGATEDADIVQLRHSSGLAFVSARIDDMSDIEGWNLEKYTAIAMGQLAEAASNPSIVYPKKISLSGNSAIQFEISGIVDSMNISYVVTLIKKEDIYIKIIAWSAKSKFPEYGKIFREELPKFVSPSSLSSKIKEAISLGISLGYDSDEVVESLKNNFADTLNFLRAKAKQEGYTNKNLTKGKL
jgi:hypothetical protein